MQRENRKDEFCSEIWARSSGAKEEAGSADVPLVAVLVKESSTWEVIAEEKRLS